MCLPVVRLSSRQGDLHMWQWGCAEEKAGGQEERELAGGKGEQAGGRGSHHCVRKMENKLRGPRSGWGGGGTDGVAAFSLLPQTLHRREDGQEAGAVRRWYCFLLSSPFYIPAPTREKRKANGDMGGCGSGAPPQFLADLPLFYCLCLATMLATWLFSQLI